MESSSLQSACHQGFPNRMPCRQSRVCCCCAAGTAHCDKSEWHQSLTSEDRGFSNPCAVNNSSFSKIIIGDPSATTRPSSIMLVCRNNSCTSLISCVVIGSSCSILFNVLRADQARQRVYPKPKCLGSWKARWQWQCVSSHLY
jgi:hypothetical protein